MKLSNKREERAPVGQLLSPNEISNTCNGFHIIELLAKVVPRKPQTIDCSPETGGQDSLLKTTLKKHIEHKVTLVIT